MAEEKPVERAETAGEVTRILQGCTSEGGEGAVSRLLPMVYAELRAMSERYLRGESPGHTLGATGLVHEAYLKLAGQWSAGFRTREEFFAAAAVAMRRTLVDHARARKRLKRGGGAQREPLDDLVDEYEARSVDLEALDGALGRLAAMDARKAVLVDLRFFGGMSLPAVAEYMGMSLRTAEREWTMTRAWLRTEVESEARVPGDEAQE